jgi:hypothetical protein
MASIRSRQDFYTLTISRIGQAGGRPTAETGGSKGARTVCSASVTSLAKRRLSRL